MSIDISKNKKWLGNKKQKEGNNQCQFIDGKKQDTQAHSQPQNQPINLNPLAIKHDLYSNSMRDCYFIFISNPHPLIQKKQWKENNTLSNTQFFIREEVDKSITNIQRWKCSNDNKMNH